MTDELNTHLMAGPTACPFVAFEDDRDHRSDAPDYRHRCFASAEPEPRAFPHQERYCLSAGFTACPIFLDWARQEAAGIAKTEAPDDDIAPVLIEGESAPAFLASRSRPTAPAEAATTASRRTAEASAGLWSNEGISRRNVPTAPPPPSSLQVPQVAMARRGPTHPGWENPPRLENFPRLRSRDERHSNTIFMAAVIGVAVIMVALVLLPVLLSRGGGSSTPNPNLVSPSNIAAASTPVPTITPTPGPTPILYTVKDAKTDPNLTVIAARYNVTPAMIVGYNAQLGGQFAIQNVNVIWKGMQFYIPPPGWTPAPASPTGPATSAPSKSPVAS